MITCPLDDNFDPDQNDDEININQTFKLASKSQKLPTGSMGKSGTSLPAKSAGKNIGKSSYTSKSNPKPGAAKLPTITPSTSNKTTLPSTNYNTGKTKSSTTFGVIWLPIRKRSKHKEHVYNAYKHNERDKERAPSMYNIMSGDSSNHHQFPKKIEEESSSSEKKLPALIGGVATANTLHDPQPDASKDRSEKPDYMTSIKEDDKEAAGDTDNEKNDSDFLENEEKAIIKPPSAFDEKSFKGNLDDNVDSVFLRPPPAHKVRSNTPTQEEDSCGIKCLYYTLQCCDCVLM